MVMKNYIAAVLGSFALMLAIAGLGYAQVVGISKLPTRVAIVNSGVQPQTPIHVA
jgi:hypothetical protein